MKTPLFLRNCLLLTATGVVAAVTAFAEDTLGYTNTPVLPDGKWKVHDLNRPQPRKVTPGTTFSDMAPPPSDAIVLFDGKDLAKWVGDKGAPTWKIEKGYMEVTPKSGSIRTRDNFGDFQLHLEFATPSEVKGDSQGRGNSGVILFGDYEVQVLDCYNNPTYADGTVGAMYGQYPPRANVARPPGTWQTFDIVFEAPKSKDGKVEKPAQATVILNGVVQHNRQAFIGTVRHAELASYPKNPRSTGPILLQDHNNPMRFRNIWIRPLGEYDQQ